MSQYGLEYLGTEGLESAIRILPLKSMEFFCHKGNAIITPFKVNFWGQSHENQKAHLKGKSYGSLLKLLPAGSLHL